MAELKFLRGLKTNFDALQKSDDNFYIVTDGDVVSLYLGEKLLASSNIDALIASEIAKVVSNAPEDFDTLKEIADWIENDTTGAAKMANDIEANSNAIINETTRATEKENELQGLIDSLEDSSHSHNNKDVLDGITTEKVSAWDESEQNAKSYADGLGVKYDAAGAADSAAAQALADAKIYADEQDVEVLDSAKTYVDEKDSSILAEAKAYADGLGVKYDAAGAAAQALQDAKDYADSLLTWGTF